jgi:transcriptional regulator with XRE-family HTH domain
MTLGARLRALRRAKRMSLRQVEAGSGVSISTLSRTERDASIPDTIILSMLAKFYEISFDSLLDLWEPSDEETEAFLIDHGYDLEKLRTEINALIDELREQTKAILSAKEQQS